MCGKEEKETRHPYLHVAPRCDGEAMLQTNGWVTPGDTVSLCFISGSSWTTSWLPQATWWWENVPQSLCIFLCLWRLYVHLGLPVRVSSQYGIWNLFCVRTISLLLFTVNVTLVGIPHWKNFSLLNLHDSLLPPHGCCYTFITLWNVKRYSYINNLFFVFAEDQRV